MRIIRNQEDLAAGLLFVLLGVGQLMLTLDSGSATDTPAWALPLVLGGLLILLGAMLWLKALSVEADGGRPLKLGPWRAWVAGPGAAAVFALLLPQAGLVLSGLALVILAAFAWAPRERPWAWAEALPPAVALALLVAWLLPRASALPLWPAAQAVGAG